MLLEKPIFVSGKNIYGFKTLRRDNGHGGALVNKVVDFSHPIGRIKSGNQVTVFDFLSTEGRTFGSLNSLQNKLLL